MNYYPSKEVLQKVIANKGDCDNVVDICRNVRYDCCQVCSINKYSGFVDINIYNQSIEQYIHSFSSDRLNKALKEYITKYGEEELFDILL